MWNNYLFITNCSPSSQTNLTVYMSIIRAFFSAHIVYKFFLLSFTFNFPLYFQAYTQPFLLLSHSWTANLFFSFFLCISLVYFTAPTCVIVVTSAPLAQPPTDACDAGMLTNEPLTGGVNGVKLYTLALHWASSYRAERIVNTYTHILVHRRQIFSRGYVRKHHSCGPASI